MKLRNKTLKELCVVVGIILISTLPYIHDLITISGEGIKIWIPNLGIQKALEDSDGYILGFSSYRVFLYTFFLHLFAHIGFLGWMLDAKGKYYRIALLVPVTLSVYALIIMLSNARQTFFNQVNTKFYITIALSLFVLGYFVLDRRNKRNRESTTVKNN